MRILLAEDELAMQKIIKVYLEREGYEVVVASNGEEALEILYKGIFDLMIVDWMMPKMSGVDVCRHVKESGIDIKMMMLTAKSEIEDEVMGLQVGVDDYVKKPFDPRILVLRIKKLLPTQEVLIHGDLTYYPERCLVERGKEKIKLSNIEQRLLTYFMKNKGIILSREKLLGQVWGLEYEGDDRTVDTHIRRLRKKIGEEMIETYRGIGYSMGEVQHE